MKRYIIVGILMLCVAGMSFSQEEQPSLINLSPLNEDFNTLFDGIGKEVIPHLQQIALSGDTFGEAELGNLPHFSISLLNAGVTISSGIGKVLDDPDTVWNFIMAFPDIISTALETLPADIQNYYNLTKSILPYPVVNLGLGLGLIGGFELFVNGFAIPQMLIDTVAGMVGIQALENAQLDIMNVTGRLRKVLLKDEGPYPAISVGLGYNYSHFQAGYGFNSLSDLGVDPVDLGIATLDLDGNFQINTLVQSVGMDFHLSKTFLILTPFIKISPWYQWTSFSSLIDFTATATVSAGETSQDETIALYINPQTSVQDMSVFLTTGVELKLLILVLSTSVSMNLENPIMLIGTLLETPILELQEPIFNGIGVHVGIRLQI